jgi:hypothetical protein
VTGLDTASEAVARRVGRPLLRGSVRRCATDAAGLLEIKCSRFGLRRSDRDPVNDKQPAEHKSNPEFFVNVQVLQLPDGGHVFWQFS